MLGGNRLLDNQGDRAGWYPVLETQAPSRLLQPFTHFLPGLSLAVRSSFKYSTISPREPFKQLKATLHELVILHIDKVCGWLTMLGDQYRLFGLGAMVISGVWGDRRMAYPVD
jgi:hypothetical protein